MSTSQRESRHLGFDDCDRIAHRNRRETRGHDRRSGRLRHSMHCGLATPMCSTLPERVEEIVTVALEVGRIDYARRLEGHLV